MPSNNIPVRWAAKDAYMRVGIAPVSGTSPVLTYTPTSDFTSLAIFGPVRNIEINAPFDELDQTAGGDYGHMSIFTRAGLWEVRADAMFDAGEVFGDYRMAELIGNYVEFLVLLGTGFSICKGVGKLNGRMTVPAAQGETVMRDMVINRWLPQVGGNILWANMKTGAFS